MNRRTVLKGLLSFPFIGFSVKAFSKQNGLYPYQQEVIDKLKNKQTVELNIPKKHRSVTFVLFFDREFIKENNFEGIEPWMVIREVEYIPSSVLRKAAFVMDMTKNKVIKNRDENVREYTEDQHKDWWMYSVHKSYFQYNYGVDVGTPELTLEIMKRNKLIKNSFIAYKNESPYYFQVDT